MARELVPAMTERGAGHMVFVSSLSGKAATARASLYCATKFGLRGFALGLREDLRGTGVGVSVVTPGAIRDAGMFADSGRQAAAGMGTATRSRSRAGVVRAIERDRAEISVAPVRQRALSAIAANAPGARRPGRGQRRRPRSPTRSPPGRRTSAEPRLGVRTEGGRDMSMSDSFSARSTLDGIADASTRSSASTRCRRGSTSPGSRTRSRCCSRTRCGSRTASR